ncbi:MAG TPA: hypothetical protein VHD69_01915 [Candidatus Paceibacterota bacterium]|jgi:hypothetical protein|nr:hypothetical protein [Candidatus Paceibacterota bacterium]
MKKLFVRLSILCRRTTRRFQDVEIEFQEGFGGGPDVSFVDDEKRALSPRERRSLCIALRKMKYAGPCASRPMRDFLISKSLLPIFFRSDFGTRITIMFQFSYEYMPLVA